MLKTILELSTLGLNSPDAQRFTPSTTLRHNVIRYPEFCSAVREIAHLHERWRTLGVAGGLLLFGQSGSGKTTVLDYYTQQFPRSVKAGVAKIPVLQVITPESPTVKSLAEAILVALGDPAASRGSAATKTTRIAHLFSRCAVELLILDEFHHFYEGHRVTEGRKVSDWLKNLLSKCAIPVVLCGLPRSIAALNANGQLRRRFSAPHHLKEFSFDTEDQQIEFRALLQALEEALPEKATAALSGPTIARRFYFATSGLIDYVVKILDRASASPCRSSSERYGLSSLAAAFRKEVWADVPEALNPFVAHETKLRLLTEAREPFDGWDEPAQYTLSKRAAKLLGISPEALGSA